jgi:hypothetical protein
MNSEIRSITTRNNSDFHRPLVNLTTYNNGTYHIYWYQSFQLI